MVIYVFIKVNKNVFNKDGEYTTSSGHTLNALGSKLDRVISYLKV